MAPKESAKDLAFYSAAISAWIDTRMEKDKTLVTLATAGVGFLVTLATAVGPTARWELWLYVGAGAAFLLSIVCAVKVFDGNSDYIAKVIKTGEIDGDRKLERLDRLVFWSFILGVLLTGAIGVSAANTRIRKAEEMAQQQQPKETTRVDTSKKEIKSLSGLGGLKPGSGTSNTGTGKPATGGGSGNQSSGSGKR